MWGFVQQMSWEKKEIEINTYDWAYVAMTGAEKKKINTRRIMFKCMLVKAV